MRTELLVTFLATFSPRGSHASRMRVHASTLRGLASTLRSIVRVAAVVFTALLSVGSTVASPLVQTDSSDLDRRVRAFLDRNRSNWRDLNVPEADGRTLHDLVLKHKYKRALEIGTSTGHSAIWIAWALSKTGGRLITIDVDERRHRIALTNFKEAGLADYIDARLADAHDLVPKLEGPFDFVFSDADKEWYTNYFVAVWPKLERGGCFTAHNVSSGQTGIREFLDHLKTVSNADTTIDRSSSAGLSITFKT
jgi:caffeoyl-CoA O-methyltransferase